MNLVDSLDLNHLFVSFVFPKFVNNYQNCTTLLRYYIALLFVRHCLVDNLICEPLISTLTPITQLVFIPPYTPLNL